ncbi:unnamed protein product, partial [Mesorhabditis belari]|uniref:histone acetyltransferase n=1 Tax=Mesorhabditis belari TaxID=2138241 RepID=A0AAF3FFW7_9BILA
MPHQIDPSCSFTEGGDCLAKDAFGVHREAQVLAKRGNENAQTEEIYVHFNGFDKRWDRWTNAGQARKFRKHYAKIRKEEKSEKEDVDDKRPRPKRQLDDHQLTLSEVEEKIRDQHEQRTRIKNIQLVHFGEWELETWYYSPYPEEVQHEKKLFVCDRCFYYCNGERRMRAHLHICKLMAPPGRKIYAEGNITIFEVNADTEDPVVKTYTQCLCLFSKLFMDNKTIYFDLREYSFYVLCQSDSSGNLRPAGYFSKQKMEPQHNLSCLVVFPAYFRHGYGLLLIQLSYELSRREGLIAGPEKPLSELGLASYRRYWSWMVIDLLRSMTDRQTIGIDEICVRLGIIDEDVRDTVFDLDLIDPKRDDAISTISTRQLDDLSEKKAKKPSLLLNPKLLKWRGNGKKT